MKLAVGLGCDRNTTVDSLQEALDQALALASATLADVVQVSSIDLKANEAGMAQLAARHGWRMRFYSAAQLAAVPVANPSETVRRHTGTPSVSEAAALLGAGQGGAAAPVANLLVEKHRLRAADGKNATVSLALCVDTGPQRGR